MYVAGPAGAPPSCGTKSLNISLPVSEIHVWNDISYWASLDFCPEMEMHPQSQNALKIAVSASVT